MKFRDPKTGKVFDDICGAHKTFCGMWCTSCPLIIAYGTKYGCESWVRKNEEKAARLMGYEVIDDSSSDSSSDSSTEIDETPTDTPTTLDDTPTGRGDRPTKEDDMDKQHETEWKAGDKAVIIDNTCNHGFDMGETVELTRESSATANFWECKSEATGDRGYVFARDMKRADKYKGSDKPAKPRLAEILGVEVGERFKVEMSYGTTDELYLDQTGVIYRDSGDARPIHSTCLCQAINHPESIIRAPRLTEQEIAIMRSVGAKWVSMDDKSYTRLKVDLWDVEPSKTSNGVYVALNVDPIARVKIYLFPSAHPGDCIELEDAK